MAQRRLRKLPDMRGECMLVCAEAQDLPRFDVTFDKVASIDAFGIDEDPSAALGTSARA